MQTKRFIILLLLAAPLALQSRAAENDTIPATEGVSNSVEAEENSQKGKHPWKEDENKNISPFFSNWSISLDAGFNSYDGDFNSEMKHAVYAPAVGLGVEYTFTPFIGIGVNYMFDMYRVTGRPGNADILLNGMMHKAGIYLPVDLFSCFAPRAEQRLVTMQLIAGGGGAWYKSDIQYPQGTRGNTANVEPTSMTEYKFCPYLNIGGNLEFNIGRSVALGVKAMYVFFTRDDIDGRYGGASVNNDGLVDVTLSLRYKINAQKRSHERNVSSGEEQTELARKAEGLPSLSEPIPTAEEVAQEILNNGLLNSVGGKDTILLIRRDTLVQNNNFYSSEVLASGNYFFVYFATGKAALSDQGLIAIQQLATRMQYEPDTYALITGYCDNTGSDLTNNLLSQKRAERVQQELIAEHGINPERLLIQGAGKIIGRQSKAAYTPNRRAEILLLTEQEFQQKKQEIRAQQEAKAQAELLQTNNGNTSSHEALNEEQQSRLLNTIQEDAPAILDTVVVKKGTTLARLARKYYNMRFDLWTYIYEANRDVITNPDKLKEGTVLIIPALTNEQIQAKTADDIATLY